MPDTDTLNEVRASYPQERIWFVHQLAPASGAYNIVFNYTVPEPSHYDALVKAFARLLERHEVLRTLFAERDGVVFQIIRPSLDIEIPLVDLSDLDEAGYAVALDSMVDGELRSPFDLERGPLIRCKALLSPSGRLTAVIVMHHIISDGWSTTVLSGDLDRLYADSLDGADPSLPPLPIQYADFSEWQRARCTSPKLQAQVAYWLQQLKDAPPVIELPLDRPRTGNPDMAGKVKMFAIPASTGAGITALARRKQATTFMVLVAALKTLLFRITGQDDIVIATVVANRTRVELECMVGCFLNNLVLRDKLSPDMTFDALVEQIRDTTLDAYSNQDAPFELVVEQLNLPRSLSHNAVFQVMVAFQNFAHDKVAESGIEEVADGGGITTSPSIAKFEMSLSMWEVGGTLGGGIEYRSDLFDDDTIDRLIRHYRTLLADGVAQPNAKLCDLKILDDQEYDKIVRVWNDWQLDYPADRLVHSVIQDQVVRTPDATAVVLGEATLTYRELNSRANRIAWRLIELGCKPERIVGVMLEQSLDMIVSILAILKAGGAYLPIDPAIPDERLAYIVRDAEPLVVLTHDDYVDSLARTGASPLRVASAADDRDDSDTNPDVVQNSRSLAYLLYTSGSTGRPKGVMVEHRSVLHHLWGMNLQYEFGPGDCFFQSHSYAFDVSVWEFFMPLVTGGRVAMVRPDGHKDPAYLVDAMVSAGVTYVCLLPPMLQLILEEPRVGELNNSVRWVICGGEPLSPELVMRCFEKLTARLDNAYGPTEATIHNTYYHCIRGPQPPVIPIGRAMPGARVYILDARLNPMPIGAPGEICIGGDAVSRGYLKSPELTAAKFVRDPFADSLGARLYRTGDIGRFLPDGHIEFLGRRDMQIKLRGFRIELGEITLTLKQHPAVKDCITIVREDRPGDRRIVSYVVAEARDDLVGSLQDYVAKRLPEHMAPSAFVRLDRLPLKDSNKVDMAALPAPSAAIRSDDFVAASTDDERKLADIWKDLLGLPQAGARDNFFELGGHSLLVTRLISRIRAEMGANLSIRQVFRTPVLGDLAMAVQSARQTSGNDRDDDIVVRRRASGRSA
nr:non-ribosomal peptide synthetase [Bradyrhizobium sp. 2S1]MCK7664908.1 non-ribosomal peptide synthetase [Bradyrhizobium sp. 2S1]